LPYNIQIYALLDLATTDDREITSLGKVGISSTNPNFRKSCDNGKISKIRIFHLFIII